MVSIGIDLGITKCCMAVYKGNKVDVIPYSNSSRTVPSYISFWKEEILFGEEAVNRMSETIENTVYDIKRFIGRRFSDPVVTSNLNKWNFKGIDQNGSAAVSVNKIVYTPQELSGLLLIELKTKAEAYLGESVSNAVITVPTYFTDSQRKATVDAGRIAGFKEVRLLNEPTAAALAYNMNHIKEEKRMKLVVDFGGSTLDVSLVECEGDNVRVMAIDGDQDMGRNDMVHSMVEHMASKCELDLNEKQTFDEVCKNIFAETQAAVERCLDDIEFNMDDIHEILMVGEFNDSKIQSIVTMLETHFKKPVSRTVNLDEAVAIGAAIYASKWDSHFFFRGVNLSNVCPYSLGIDVGNNEDPKNGNVLDIVIKRYSSLPVKNTKKYFTAEDSQTAIKLSVYCGEHKLVKNNKLLGNIKMNGLRPAPVSVEVTFELDINGILNVTLVDPERCTSKYLRLVLDKEGDIEKDMKTTMDLTQKRYSQSQEIKIFKESKNYLADLCDTLKKKYLSKWDNLEFNAENSKWLEDMRLDLESIEKKVTNSPF